MEVVYTENLLEGINFIVDEEDTVMIYWTYSSNDMLLDKLTILDCDVLIIDVYGTLQNAIEDYNKTHNKDYMFYVYTKEYVRCTDYLTKVDELDYSKDNLLLYVDYNTFYTVKDLPKADTFIYLCDDEFYEHEIPLFIHRLNKFISAFGSCKIEIIFGNIFYCSENFDLKLFIDILNNELCCRVVVVHCMNNKNIDMISYYDRMYDE